MRETFIRVSDGQVLSMLFTVGFAQLVIMGGDKAIFLPLMLGPLRYLSCSIRKMSVVEPSEQCD